MKKLMLLLIAVISFVTFGCNLEDILGNPDDVNDDRDSTKTNVYVSLLSPEDGTTQKSASVTLRWSGTGYTYDVYFGTSYSTLSKIADSLTITSYTKRGLSSGTTYYWKVVAKKGTNSVVSAIRSFYVKSTAVSLAELKTMIANGEDVTKVDVSQITDMSGLFYRNKTFNQDISGWDVSNVTNMNSMFYCASVFDQDISRWNVSKVTSYVAFDKGTNLNWTSVEKPNFVVADSLYIVLTSPSDTIYQSTSVTLRWSGNATTYDVYFGTSSTSLNKIASGLTDLSYTKSGLSSGTTYCWRIVGKRDSNNVIASPIKYFYLKSAAVTLAELKAMIANGEDVTKVDVSQITDMSNLFSGNTTFNQDISAWDVSNVTNMSYMFSGADAFNQDISKWNVSNVTDMSYMFYTADAFNQNIGNWDVSNVINMQNMFQFAYAFNQNIGSWNVSNVKNMLNMFYSAFAFNQDISKWNVGNVTNMHYMFYTAKAFDQNISAWDVSKVTSYNGFDLMTSSSWTSTEKPKFGVSAVTLAELKTMIANGEDVTKVDVSQITDMSGLFYRNKTFNQDISAWDVSNVTNMNSIFRDASAFNQDIGSWNVSNVTSMSYMFGGASAFNQDISKWNVSKATLMVGMFYKAYNFNQNIGNWNVSNVTSMYCMFNGASAFDQDLSKWDVSKVTNYEVFDSYTSSNWTPTEKPNFVVADSLYIVLTSPSDTIYQSTSVTLRWSGNATTYDVYFGTSSTSLNKIASGLTDLSYTKSGLSSGTTYCWRIVGKRDSNNVIASPIKYFYFKSAAVTLAELKAMIANGEDVTKVDVSKITDMSGLLYGNTTFNQDISGWNVSNVTNMKNMFREAKVFNQNIGSWDVSNVTDMSAMFRQSLAFNQDIGGWKVGKVTDMSEMFSTANAFNQDISDWDVSNVTNMYSMFESATSFDQDISSWKVSKVTNHVKFDTWANCTGTNWTSAEKPNFN